MYLKLQLSGSAQTSMLGELPARVLAQHEHMSRPTRHNYRRNVYEMNLGS